LSEDRLVSTTRLPIPGPSFIREEPVRLRAGFGEPERAAEAGMTAPSVMEDGWWLSTLWVGDAGGVISSAVVAPLAGPPPLAPLQVIGPNLAGALAGLLGQADGRQLIRMRMPPAPDETRLWERPLVLWMAVVWDPVRASTMRPNELARELLRAFARSVEAAGSPA
jgi:hypothetical protein